MKLKCIGGLNDGEYGFTHDDKPRVGEYVRMSGKAKYSITDPMYWNAEDELNKPVVDNIVMYIVDRDNDGLFLRLP